MVRGPNGEMDIFKKQDTKEREENQYIFLVVGSFNHVPHGEVKLVCRLELAIG